MRHEYADEYSGMVNRFEDEINLLTKLTNDVNAPAAIICIYDSGFVPVKLLPKSTITGNAKS